MINEINTIDDNDITQDIYTDDVELSVELDYLYNETLELANIYNNYNKQQLAKEELIFSLGRLGFEYNEISLALEDWEETKSKIKESLSNLLADTLIAIKRLAEKAFYRLAQLVKDMSHYILNNTKTLIMIKEKLSPLDKSTEIMPNQKVTEYIKKKFPIFLHDNKTLEFEKILAFASDTKQINTLFKNLSNIVKDYDSSISTSDLVEDLEDLDNGINIGEFRRELLNQPVLSKYENICLINVIGKSVETLIIDNNKKKPALNVVKTKLDTYVDAIDLSNFRTVGDVLENIDIILNYSNLFTNFDKHLNTYNKISKETIKMIEKKIKDDLKQNLDKAEQREESKKFDILEHSLNILNKKIISSAVSGFFWNLRYSINVIKFLTHSYLK